jgi:hypothetical protein
MKRLIAIVLVALLMPVPVAEAKVCKVSRVYHTSHTTYKTTARMHYACN